MFRLLKRSGCLDSYIVPHFDVLHTLGKNYLISDIEEYLKPRGEKKDCRNGGEEYQAFKIIKGKVANDKVYRVVEFYNNGIRALIFTSENFLRRRFRFSNRVRNIPFAINYARFSVKQIN